MVEIGKLIVFNFIHLFAEKNSLYSAVGLCLCCLVAACCLQSMNGMWNPSSLNKTIREIHLEHIWIHFEFIHRFASTFGIRQGISILEYLHRQSKMDRSHVYSTIIWQRPLSNTWLQCAKRWNDPEKMEEANARLMLIIRFWVEIRTSLKNKIRE